MLDEDDQMDEILKEIVRSTDKLFGPEHKAARKEAKRAKKMAEIKAKADEVKAKKELEKAKKEEEKRKKRAAEKLARRKQKKAEEKAKKAEERERARNKRLAEARLRNLNKPPKTTPVDTDTSNKKPRFKAETEEFKNLTPKQKTIYSRIRKRQEENKDRFQTELMTELEFVELVTQKFDCIYCGRSATGFDRVDNKAGYSKDNCKPCCKVCNRMKWSDSQEEFLKHIKAIYLHNFTEKT